MCKSIMRQLPRIILKKPASTALCLFYFPFLPSYLLECGCSGWCLSGYLGTWDDVGHGDSNILKFPQDPPTGLGWFFRLEMGSVRRILCLPLEIKDENASYWGYNSQSNVEERHRLYQTAINSRLAFILSCVFWIHEGDEYLLTVTLV